MKKTHLLVFASLLVLGAFALPLLAASANFQGNCAAGIPTSCVFNANRTPAGQTATSCSPSTVSQYFWDFNSTITTDDLFTTSSFVSYTYPGQYCDFVDMAVFCNNGMSATKSHCICNYLGFGGCIIPGAGWTP